MDLGAILKWLKYRKAAKNRKIIESILTNLNSLTVTVHGRQLLSAALHDEESDLPPEIRRMYWILLQSAPVEEYASYN